MALTQGLVPTRQYLGERYELTQNRSRSAARLEPTLVLSQPLPLVDLCRRYFSISIASGGYVRKRSIDRSLFKIEGCIVDLYRGELCVCPVSVMIAVT